MGSAEADRVTVRKAPAGTVRGQVSAGIQRYGLVIALILVVALFGALSPSLYLSASNAANILGSQSVLVVVALALLLALRVGEYDLSVASVLTLSSAIVGVLNGQMAVPILASIAIAVLVGALIGLINGFFVVQVGVDSIVATLGTATFLQGVSLWLTDTQTITGISRGLVNLVVRQRFLGVPLSFYYALAATVMIWYLFRYTVAGRRMLYVGRNREVARLSGIHVGRVRWLALIGAGALSAAAGVVYTGTSGVASPTSGLSFLLPAFAATFLGATSIRVGEFNPWGTFIAAYFLASGVTGLSILGGSSFVQQIFYGTALIAAVTISKAASRHRS